MARIVHPPPTGPLPPPFMKRSLVLLLAYFSLVASPAVGQRREGNFRDLRDSQIGPTVPYWSQFLHPRYAYEFPVPPGMSEIGRPGDSPETAFESSDGSFVISAWGGRSTQSPAFLLEEQWRSAERRPDRTINYRRRAGSWFVVSGTERNGTEFYEKFISRGNQVAAFSLKYPRSRLREFEPWVEKIEDGFRIVSNPSRTAVLAPRIVPAASKPPSRGEKHSVTETNRPVTQPSPARSEDRARITPPELTKARAAPASSRKAPEPDLSNRKAVPPETETADLPPALETDRPAPNKGPGPAITFASKEIPLASKVPGRPGFVHSPYTSDKSLVDVVGIPSGTKVKCPYSNKVFRVP